MMRHATALLLLALARPATAGDCPPDSWQARAAVEAYYAAINASDYAAAYGHWADAGRASGQGAEAFAAGFAETVASTVFTAPATDLEGAAGSIYATVPVRVEARLADGTLQRFAGAYTLSRVNDVPGATADQLSWHIRSAELTAVE